MVESKQNIYGKNEKMINYVYKIGNRISDTKKELRKETNEKFPDNSIMLVEVSQGELLKKLVQLSHSKTGIEIGVFTGYSALCMAEGLPEDGKLICCDISEEFTNLGKKYWEKAGVLKKIDLRLAPGIETLDKFIKEGKKFDFAFVDADKENYIEYYERLLKLIVKGGFIMFDNTLWFGRVCEKVISEKDVETFTLNKLNNLIQGDKRVEINQLPISDGFTIVYVL